MVYIFPALLIALTAVFTVAIVKAGKAGIPGGGVISPQRRFGRADAVIALVLTLVYGAVNFTGLGDTQAPQSFYQFTSDTRELIVDLGASYEISTIIYYDGGGHAEEGYSLHITEGGDWTKLVRPAEEEGSAPIAALEHNYTSLYKWFFTSMESLQTEDGGSAAVRSARYVRLYAGVNDLKLGLLAFVDANGEIIDPSGFTCYIGDETQFGSLFDEYELIPERSTYMNSTYFDEIYHARTAYEFLQSEHIYETTHPPLGKLIIAIGIELFGMTPFGWRFSGALFGTLMVPLFYALARSLFSRKSSLCGTLIFAFDFMHFTQTRISTIDTYCVFFTLLMYLLMLTFVRAGFDASPRRQLVPLALCGIAFGLGAAAKWQCFYAAGGLAVIYFWHVIREGIRLTRAGEGYRFRARLGAVLIVSVLFFIVAAGAIYVLSYLPYARANGETLSLGYVWERQLDMYRYHSELEATHPYQSAWYQWLLDLRPILYYREYLDGGYVSLIAAWLGPVACWAGLTALVSECVLRFRMKGGSMVEPPQSRSVIWFIAVGWLAMLLPWVMITRCAFAYHYFPCLIFLTLALCASFDRLFKYSPTEGYSRTKVGKVIFSPGVVRRLPVILAVSAVVLFAMFYPALSGVPAPQWWFRNFLKWIPSWPL